MPQRPLNREQVWLIPPAMDELIGQDHPARFVAAFVDALDQAGWAEMGIERDGGPMGAPSYHPVALLSVWLYGFMTGVRSTRKLEAACRDQIPYLWLTAWQHPDHNTLWRFYEANREGMRRLLKRTVRTAVRAGLMDLAVQAVDGTKIAGNAAKDRTYDAEGLSKLLERTDAAIAELEAQNQGGDDPPPPRLPIELAQQKALQEQVERALAQVTAEEGPARVNLTDEDASLMKGRQGFVVGYNSQAMVSPLNSETAQRTGLLITAAEVVTDPFDHAQLLPMLKAAEELTGRRADLTLADGGYHSGANLAACEEREQEVLMSEAQRKALKDPYHKDAFTYDAENDCYTCPEGQRLSFRGMKERESRPVMLVYRGSGAVCRACPAFGVCTKDKRQGRALEVGPHERVLRSHRERMQRAEAKEAYRQRKELPEPAFGIIKEQMGVRRFLLRGLLKVGAEWSLVGTAFNLRTLSRVWQGWAPERRWALTGVGTV